MLLSGKHRIVHKNYTIRNERIGSAILLHDVDVGWERLEPIELVYKLNTYFQVYGFHILT